MLRWVRLGTTSGERFNSEGSWEVANPKREGESNGPKVLSPPLLGLLLSTLWLPIFIPSGGRKTDWTPHRYAPSDQVKDAGDMTGGGIERLLLMIEVSR
jgi:hypothetical protein